MEIGKVLENVVLKERCSLIRVVYCRATVLKARHEFTPPLSTGHNYKRQILK